MKERGEKGKCLEMRVGGLGPLTVARVTEVSEVNSTGGVKLFLWFANTEELIVFALILT